MYTQTKDALGCHMPVQLLILPLNLTYLVDSIDICMIFDDGLVPSSNWIRSLMPGLWNATVINDINTNVN